MTFPPFRIEVSDKVLDDLRARLRQTRFTAPTGAEPWASGADPDYLRKLVAYWVDGFDWRAREAELNALSHHRERGTHFVRVAGAGPDPMPIVLLHGWPSSFLEMLPLAQHLADPARFGGDPADAFDVVIPSMPGFLYSGLPSEPLTRAAMARVIHTLMTETLGHDRYAAFGGDIGGGTAQWLGALHPESIIGLHLIHPPFPASFDEPPMSPEEEAFVAAEEAYDETDGGYSAIMGTRPDTIAAALLDSPAGLAAWIVDKYRDWSDCGGDVESRFDRDALLTILTLYWATGSIGTSFRQYYDWPHNTPRTRITVPTAVTLSHEPSMASVPRSIAERACTNLHHWTEPRRGGHFLAWEEPELMHNELTTSFRPLRHP
ncbi:Pimeloyl-ACP methyl ester carboxylesterase [Nonomuraea solani]|uniref:Pimeloyl-ACP methyl ester carboxylesterase n=1 Tax=Nonomuraea solani TaxID=1144553 RepID=A0A1H5TYY7_9ACTN|nr:epoxide hydrolase family protein [Nonomuraea solani]SEF68003.1 Pimeloyl-ACP methyl ester carboxylesterase [Nonomuraea solani]